MVPRKGHGHLISKKSFRNASEFHAASNAHGSVNYANYARRNSMVPRKGHGSLVNKKTLNVGTSSHINRLSNATHNSVNHTSYTRRNIMISKNQDVHTVSKKSFSASYRNKKLGKLVTQLSNLDKPTLGWLVGNAPLPGLARNLSNDVGKHHRDGGILNKKDRFVHSTDMVLEDAPIIANLSEGDFIMENSTPNLQNMFSDIDNTNLQSTVRENATFADQSSSNIIGSNVEHNVVVPKSESNDVFPKTKSDTNIPKSDALKNDSKVSLVTSYNHLKDISSMMRGFDEMLQNMTSDLEKTVTKNESPKEKLAELSERSMTLNSNTLIPDLTNSSDNTESVTEITDKPTTVETQNKTLSTDALQHYVSLDLPSPVLNGKNLCMNVTNIRGSNIKEKSKAKVFVFHCKENNKGQTNDNIEDEKAKKNSQETGPAQTPTNGTVFAPTDLYKKTSYPKLRSSLKNMSQINDSVLVDDYISFLNGSRVFKGETPSENSALANFFKQTEEYVAKNPTDNEAKHFTAKKNSTNKEKLARAFEKLSKGKSINKFKAYTPVLLIVNRNNKQYRPLDVKKQMFLIDKFLHDIRLVNWQRFKKKQNFHGNRNVDENQFKQKAAESSVDKHRYRHNRKKENKKKIKNKSASYFKSFKKDENEFEDKENDKIDGNYEFSFQDNIDKMVLEKVAHSKPNPFSSDNHYQINNENNLKEYGNSNDDLMSENMAEANFDDKFVKKVSNYPSQISFKSSPKKTENHLYNPEKHKLDNGMDEIKLALDDYEKRYKANQIKNQQKLRAQKKHIQSQKKMKNSLQISNYYAQPLPSQSKVKNSFQTLNRNSNYYAEPLPSQSKIQNSFQTINNRKIDSEYYVEHKGRKHLPLDSAYTYKNDPFERYQGQSEYFGDTDDVETQPFSNIDGGGNNNYEYRPNYMSPSYYNKNDMPPLYYNRKDFEAKEAGLVNRNNIYQWSTKNRIVNYTQAQAQNVNKQQLYTPSVRQFNQNRQQYLSQFQYLKPKLVAYFAKANKTTIVPNSNQVFGGFVDESMKSLLLNANNRMVPLAMNTRKTIQSMIKNDVSQPKGLDPYLNNIING